MRTLHTTADAAGQRLDTWLAKTRPVQSRSRWQQLIKDGHVRVNGEIKKPQYQLAGGEELSYEVPEPESIALSPENIPLDILYEDRDIIVVNKPAGMVVHPAPGNYTGTLVHALLYHCHDLMGIGGELRPGIVHRLDKNTSGCMISAKNEQAMRALVSAFKKRQVNKEYLALVSGIIRPAKATIETLIGRSKTNRKKMSTRPPSGGRKAISHYEVVEQFKEAALVKVKLETGRTHQIRVHMAHIGHPILGDQQYGKPGRDPARAERQMLHAAVLSLQHPASSQPMTFTAPLPDDMQQVLNRLR